MTTTQRVATIVMLVPGAVFTGVIAAYAIDRTSVWARMPLEQYAVDFRRSLYRADPLQPILLVITAAGAVLFARSASGAAAQFTWASVAQLGVIFVASLLIAEPMNSKFRRLPEGSIPNEAERLRQRWRRFHTVRTVVALGAWTCLVLATTYV